MRTLDEQEKHIVRALIRNPRESDNHIGEITGVNIRTVNRKRKQLEQEGILSYYTQVDLSEDGAQQFNTRNLYVVKFRAGVTYQQMVDDIAREPKVRNIFGEVIFESFIAEIDGNVALLLFVEGINDRKLVQTVQDKLIPSLLKNHGANSIEEISTLRILAPVRVMRNYLPSINMKDGHMVEDWPEEAIYVGE